MKDYLKKYAYLCAHRISELEETLKVSLKRPLYLIQYQIIWSLYSLWQVHGIEEKRAVSFMGLKTCSIF